MSSKILDTGVEAYPGHELQRRAPYYAKVLGVIEREDASGWEDLRVGIYERDAEHDRLIGEYVRNYPSLERTFHPFQLRGKWYALYSKDYSYTHLMELPSCKDIGGEYQDEWDQFCPVDYWVPPLSYQKIEHQAGCLRSVDDSKSCICSIQHRFDCPSSSSRYRDSSCICQEEWEAFHKAFLVWHMPDRIHGFVAGCAWGDDSSWKIQYLDLSRADEGIVIREERFGYVELPERLRLCEAIRIHRGGSGLITFTLEKHFCLKTGKPEE